MKLCDLKSGIFGLATVTILFTGCAPHCETGYMDVKSKQCLTYDNLGDRYEASAIKAINDNDFNLAKTILEQWGDVLAKEKMATIGGRDVKTRAYNRHHSKKLYDQHHKVEMMLVNAINDWQCEHNLTGCYVIKTTPFVASEIDYDDNNYY